MGLFGKGHSDTADISVEATQKKIDEALEKAESSSSTPIYEPEKD